MLSYTVVVNNKNGNIWTNIPDIDKMKMDVGIGVNLNLKDLEKAIYEYETKNGNKVPRRAVGFGGSIQIGNVVGKSKGDDIDDAIKGSSFGGTVCKGVCIGFSKAGGKDGATIITSGVGTPQIGMGGSIMRPINESEQKLLKKLGILK